MSSVLSVHLSMIIVTSKGLGRLEFFDTAGHMNLKSYDGETFAAALQQLEYAEAPAEQMAGLRTLGIIPDEHNTRWITQLDDETLADLGRPDSGATLHLLQLVRHSSGAANPPRAGRPPQWGTLARELPLINKVVIRR